jgi:hypothetical protein
VPNRPRLRNLALGVAAAAAAAALFAAVGGATTQATAPSNTARPAVSGDATAGSQLTTSTGTWSGTSPITFHYVWQRCDASGGSCTSIAGQADDTYTVASADVGHRLRSMVTAQNSAGQSTKASDTTAVVTASSGPQNTSAPTIGGSATVGSTLTTSNGNWSGSTPMTYTYDWQRCDASGNNCTPIGLHSDNQTYVVTGDDAGHTLRSVVTATNSSGHATAASAVTSVVSANGPTNTAVPTITGAASVGSNLATSSGTWTSPTSVTYAYEWDRCDTGGNNCSAISGATSATYTVTTADLGHTLRSKITGTNSSGSASASSVPFGPVTGGPNPPQPVGGTIAASAVPDSDRLTISEIKFSGGGFHGRGPISASFKVVDSNQRLVTGALVYVLPAPRNQANHPAETPTGANGWASVAMTLTSKAPRSGWLLLFVRARTPQGNLLAGSSTRRLVQVRIKAS